MYIRVRTRGGWQHFVRARQVQAATLRSGHVAPSHRPAAATDRDGDVICDHREKRKMHPYSF